MFCKPAILVLNNREVFRVIFARIYFCTQLYLVNEMWTIMYRKPWSFTVAGERFQGEKFTFFYQYWNSPLFTWITTCVEIVFKKYDFYICSYVHPHSHPHSHSRILLYRTVFELLYLYQICLYNRFIFSGEKKFLSLFPGFIYILYSPLFSVFLKNRYSDFKLRYFDGNALD